MQSTNLPSKFLVPFAKNDSAKVELPVTTATAGRASQSLGFPPITGQPPEAGGLPPQLEDFNGAVNQVARIAWWAQLGGLFGYDGTFASDANIGGYPLGAELAAADNAGTWLSLADNNVANPDTNGTGWAPARAYGSFALTAQTGGTVTPTPLQAMKRRIAIGGTLTSNLTVVLPNWLYEWTIVNSTSGAFTVTVKTAAGSGVVVPQNGASTPVVGDGTNIAAKTDNIGAATTPTQAMQLGQAVGRLIKVTTFISNGTFTAQAATKLVRVRGVGGGGAGGSTGAQGSGQCSVGSGGGSGAFFEGYWTTGFASVAVTIGGGGAPALGQAGGQGGTTSFGSLASAPGGGGGGTSQAATSVAYFLAGQGGAAVNASVNSFMAALGFGGNPGAVGLGYGGALLSGQGASSPFGGGANNTNNGVGNPGTGFGTGGSGAATGQNTAGSLGGAGQSGLVIVEEYS